MQRREFLGTIGGATLRREAQAPRPFSFLEDTALLAQLDVGRPRLGRVVADWRAGNRDAALKRLLEYFRRRNSVSYDPGLFASEPARPVAVADRLLDEHLFDLGLGYPPQRYPPPIQWSDDPLGDIEWVAGMHRFVWQDALLAAYRETGSERYAAGWARLAADWFSQHAVVDPQRFEWLDIQVGIRAARLAAASECLKRSSAFTGEFLLRFLGAVYAHARKSYLYPRHTTHNKAIIEADGLFRLTTLFPEFHEAPLWRSRAVEVLESNLEAQLTLEGVQREWTPVYHNLVAALLVDLLWLAKLNRIPLPGSLRAATRRMMDFSVAMTAPDWSFPMFGDSRREAGAERSADRPWRPLLRAAELFDEPEWRACARGDPSGMRMRSRCFAASGMYFFRTGWSPEAVYIALHCSPPAISGHDQPDNKTFELYAGGRWLMPDSGVFAYPNTPFAGEREWFRQTAVHQTLTLDRRNSDNCPRHLLWFSEAGFECLVVENRSYPRLTHRRTVFFLGGKTFVLLDEAIGDASGIVELHFQFAPGPFELDAARRRASTRFAEGTNVLLAVCPESLIEMIAERGQVSVALNRKQERPALACRHRLGPPVHFLTQLALFKQQPPATRVAIHGPFHCGQPRVELFVGLGGETWRVGRDLQRKAAWCVPVAGTSARAGDT